MASPAVIERADSDARPSPRLEVTLEIHRPGLGLHTKRWNYHTIFMAEVQANLARVIGQAHEGFRRDGCGALFADAAQWLRVVKRRFDAVTEDFPTRYVPIGELPPGVDFGPLQQGFEALLRGYDPDRQFVLVVNHHPGDLLSCYVIENPPASYGRDVD